MIFSRDVSVKLIQVHRTILAVLDKTEHSGRDNNAKICILNLLIADLRFHTGKCPSLSSVVTYDHRDFLVLTMQI